MTFRDIRHAQQRIWPAVQDSIARHTAARDALTVDSSTAAKARARKPWNRVVMEESVWAMAHEDLLATPEAAEVVRAAKEWAASWPEPPEENGSDPEALTDCALYQAVQALASSLAAVPDDDA
jgi:hypothetical protein